MSNVIVIEFGSNLDTQGGNFAKLMSNTSGNNRKFNYRSVVVLCFALVQHKLLGPQQQQRIFIVLMET